MLTMTIKATTPQAVDRLMKGLVNMLTKPELEAFQKKIQQEITRAKRKESKK
jgi:hypothetical protein